ncbi:PorH family porin [Corynebacterium testudinoris]|uniref:Uncharacterized protein n=1 Tax=Corynebacterium testudinoris TaxID=136857 RepID=A0A0G3H8P2_9CORY|nr:PorH family porin [Corynebacterium testudinoris]AKK09761.1 hypothetical protein CTEST_11770 [Corynebacterium testudinoris]MBX8996233.1 PorH family porin [Corynebacterium testudinoris]
MDLDFIQENLGNFATFGKNVGKAFQEIPLLLKGFVDFFDNFGNLSSNAEFTSSKEFTGKE